MRRQIIIATRDTQFRDSLKRVCSGQGCRIETADSVATALEIADHEPVCVMITDLSLQDVGDGVGLANAIHSRNNDATCFLVVDKESSDISSTAEAESWLKFIHKPISMLRFAAAVVDAIAD